MSIAAAAGSATSAAAPTAMAAAERRAIEIPGSQSQAQISTRSAAPPASCREGVAQATATR